MKNKIMNFLFAVIVVMASFSVCFNVANITTVEVKGENESNQPELETPTIDPSTVNGAYTNAIDCYMAALKMEEEGRNFKIHITGTVTAGAMGINITQPFVSELIVDNNDNVYSDDSTYAKSSFTESNATRIFYNKNQEGVLIKRTSKVKEDLSATFSNQTDTITKEQYIYEFGYLPSGSPCDINQNTIESIDKFSFDGEKYIIKFTLKDTAPTEQYKQKIARMAGAKKPPKFTKCTYSYIISKDGRIQQIDIVEKYTINVGINSNVTNKITHKYEYSEDTIELTKEYMER